MDCLADTFVSDSVLNFKCKKESQKYLIEFMLKCGSYDLQDLAELLDVNVLQLSDVLCGKSYLNTDVSKNLVNWFVLLLRE
ncbi:MAG TPA: hypothetical protein PK657_02550 [Legionella sp.]|nr:hypothetical protein [Legionella sp.]